MAQQYDNTNKGVLFKNAEKKSDTHADYNGTLNFEGKDYWLNGWLNTSKNGNKYISLSLKEKQSVHNDGMQATQAALNAQPDNFIDDDDIPF